MPRGTCDLHAAGVRECEDNMVYKRIASCDFGGGVNDLLK